METTGLRENSQVEIAFKSRVFCEDIFNEFLDSAGNDDHGCRQRKANPSERRGRKATGLNHSFRIVTWQQGCLNFVHNRDRPEAFSDRSFCFCGVQLLVSTSGGHTVRASWHVLAEAGREGQRGLRPVMRKTGKLRLSPDSSGLTMSVAVVSRISTNPAAAKAWRSSCRSKPQWKTPVLSS